jgi:hypothetical protein
VSGSSVPVSQTTNISRLPPPPSNSTTTTLKTIAKMLTYPQWRTQEFCSGGFNKFS